MHPVFLAALALGSPQPTTTDPCVAAVPVALRQVLAEQFRDVRLPLTSDSAPEVRTYAKADGKSCLLVAKADFNGDGRDDVALVLPRRTAPGYRLVVALDLPAGFSATSLQSWNQAMTNLSVDVAKPGTYSHTEAYEYQPEAGSSETTTSALPGFWFGEVEGGADVYFLNQGKWTFVHASD